MDSARRADDAAITLKPQKEHRLAMSAPTPYKTVTEALNSLTVPELKALSARLPDTRGCNRKGEIVDEIRPNLVGDRLRSLWTKLDKLQKAAVQAVYLVFWSSVSVTPDDHC